MPQFRARLLWPTLGLTLALTSTLGCRGCDQGGHAPAVTEQREVQPENAQLRARVDAKKLDRSKVYPKAADGSVTCGADTACFIVQADACAKAEATYSQDMSGFGMLQRVEYLYRIDGKEAGQCKVTRRVTAIGVELSKPLVDLLHEKGKTDAEIQRMKNESEDNLRTTNPTLIECWLRQETLLEAVLDLADKKYMPQVWRNACREVSADNIPPVENAFQQTGGTGGAGGK